MQSELGQALTHVFDHLYIINLPFRTDRRAGIAAQLALVGLSLDHPQVTLFPAIRPTEAGDWPSIGCRGCYYSHLGVLADAVGAGHGSIAILEDDMDWSRAFLTTPAEQARRWRDADWDFLHAGLDKADGPVALATLPPDKEVLLAHFIGLRGPAIAEAHDFLTAIAGRPAGSAEGGRMHVDGAYFWYRRAHPHRMAVMAVPCLARQRSSRTDIHDLGLTDRIPVVRTLRNGLRRLRNRITPT
jgi:hypothetical protein